MKKRESAPAGWYYDPAFRFTQRFWDGETWTDRVASGTTELNDPLGVKKISVHYSPAGVFSETPTGWRGGEVKKNDSSWLTSSESEAIRQELREAKEQRETSLVTIFCRSACITGPLSAIFFFLSRPYGPDEIRVFSIELVLGVVLNGAFWGGLIVGGVALVRKVRKGKG